VLNVVTDGPGVGEEMSLHPGVDKIAFTGSTEVGQRLVAQASGTLKRLHLELGGKSPSIIFADADLERSVKTSLFWLVNAGQQCAALSRILVEESVYDDCVEIIAATCRALQLGDPREPGTTMGPLIRESARQRVEKYVALAEEEGGEVVCGGRRPAHLEKGFFYEPTLITGVANSSRVAQEEIFGPVAVAIPFRDEEEAVRLANDSIYGLIGAVFSADVQRCWRVANQVRTGSMWINGGGSVGTPYGGFKQSGWGRGHGEWGFDAFSEVKGISWPAGTPHPTSGGH
jgi:aldehyde dehydrogenase (NAD+)